MVGRRLVEILAPQTTPLDRFGVVVLEAHDPLARRRRVRALSDRGLDLSDAAEIAVDRDEFLDAAPRRMRVRVDEAREYRAPRGVDHLSVRPFQVHHVFVGANRGEPTVGDGERLGARLRGVGRVDPAMAEDHIRRAALELRCHHGSGDGQTRGRKAGRDGARPLENGPTILRCHGGSLEGRVRLRAYFRLERGTASGSFQIQ
jgi:hypothetical protein